MPIDPFRTPTFSLTQGARRLPRLRRNRPVSPSTLYRWSTIGLRGVRLETTMLGGVRVTSEDALRRFFTELDNRSENVTRATEDDSSAAATADELIERELDDIGIR